MMKELGLPHVDFESWIDLADKVDKDQTRQFIDGLRYEASKEVGW